MSDLVDFGDVKALLVQLVDECIELALHDQEHLEGSQGNWLGEDLLVA